MLKLKLSRNSLSNFRLVITSLVVLIGVFLIACTSNHKDKIDYSKYSKSELNELLCEAVQPTNGYRKKDAFKTEDSLKIIELLNAGADPNYNCHYKLKRVKLLEAIVTFGSRDNYVVRYTRDYTPTSYFLVREDVPLFKKCIENGGEIDSTDLEITDNLEIWKFLFKRGWSMENVPFVPETFAKDSNSVQFLLDNGFGINDSINEDGSTLFYVLCSQKQLGNTKMFDYLYRNGADINYMPSKSIFNPPPLFMFVKNQEREAFNWLLEKGVEVKSNYYFRSNSLLGHIAHHSKNDELYDMAKALLDKHPDFDVNESVFISSGFSNSPLQSAIKNSNYKMISLFIEHGATVLKKGAFSDPKEGNAFEYAIQSADPEALKILLETKGEYAYPELLVETINRKISYLTENEFDEDYIERHRECLSVIKSYFCHG